MNELRLSVVVCTHNRPRDLERCLEALAALEEPAEVIVVDSASDPPCQKLVERYRPLVPALRLAREETPGLSRARNRGFLEASAAVVAFVDDDAAPRPDWGGRVLAAFDADPRVGCVGGACVPVFDGERPRWLSDRLLQFAGITALGPHAREARSSAEWPFGANMAFRRDVLAQAGPFPESLGREGATLLSGDEGPVIESVRRLGFTVWLEPSAIVDHSVPVERCTGRYYWRRLWWQGVTRSRGATRPFLLGIRLSLAAVVRFTAFVLTRDRVFLYRTAESAGFLVDRARLARRSP